MLPAPTTNRFLKSGVVPVPSQSAHPDGIALDAPDQIMIPPTGIVPPRDVHSGAALVPHVFKNWTSVPFPNVVVLLLAD